MRRTWRRTADVVAMVLLVAIALAPLRSLFGASAVAAPMLGGILAGAALAVVGRWRRWPVLITSAVGLVLFAVVGGAIVVPTMTIAGVIPSLDSLRWLGAGVINVWARLMTVMPPVGHGGGFGLAPFTLAFVGAAGSIGLALRRRRTIACWAPAVPAGVLVISLVFCTAIPVAPLALGITWSALALVWLAWRWGALRPRRVVALGVMASCVVGAGLGAGYGLPQIQERFVVRDRVEPPFDPNDYVSPLSTYRKFIKDFENEPLVAVTGLPTGAVIRLATMDDYDGVVWNVVGSGAEALGQFRRIGDTIEQIPDQGDEKITVTFEMSQEQGIWLYSFGAPEDIAFAGPHGTQLHDDVRYNDTSGSFAIPGGLPESDLPLTYQMTALWRPVPDALEVAKAEAVTTTMPQPRRVPEIVRIKASEYASGGGTGAQLAQTLADGLRDNGFFSNGQRGSVRPDIEVRPGHGADRIATLLEADPLMLGDAEQYAAAMALMARELGLPARVVMGFAPWAYGREPALEGDKLVLTGADMDAWVEIDLVGLGWVPFFPVPDPDKAPSQDTEAESPQPVPQRVQPPLPETPPSEPPDEDRERPETAEASNTETPKVVEPAQFPLAIVLSVAIPLLAAAIPLLLILAIKAIRRRRRRLGGDPMRQISGGWNEILDSLADMRVSVPPVATRTEKAAVASQVLEPTVAAGVMVLARQSDEAVFGGVHPSHHASVAFWTTVRSVRRASLHSVGAFRRLGVRLSLRSLRRRRQSPRR